ncbi:MAG: alpha/beta family hydrolase [Geminicoccaceae bacterium]
MSDGEAVRIEVEGQGAVSGLWLAPPSASAALVLAHGAGAGMAHRGMAGLAAGLADRHVATLRFQFPFMERGSRRPDPPAIAQAAVRGAVAATRGLAPALPLFAGGRSFGGRMTAYAGAEAPLPGVRGLVFFAFPLHPAGKPGTDRAVPLAAVGLPMLFLQGTRDALARLDLLQATVAGLGPRATLELAADADHDFHVPKRTGRSDTEVLAGLLDAAAAWMAAQASARA